MRSSTHARGSRARVRPTSKLKSQEGVENGSAKGRLYHHDQLRTNNQRGDSNSGIARTVQTGRRKGTAGAGGHKAKGRRQEARRVDRTTNDCEEMSCSHEPASSSLLHGS